MFHPILEIGDKLNWDPVVRDGWQQGEGAGGTPLPIPDKSFLVDRFLFLIGCQNLDAKPNWIRGCFVSQLLLTSPTTYQPQFIDLVETEKRVFIPLNRWKLVRFTDYGVNPYLLNISIPKYHKKFYLEIWKYSGVDSDSVEAKLETLT